MPLSFVNPALLFGALASALPVIIHFLSRRRVQRRQFSDLRFLTEVQARQTRRLSVRRLLLLLLRVLAILLLVLGVAGPRWGGLGGGLAEHSVLLVLDTSASMGTQEDQGTRMEQAVKDAQRMIALLPGRTSVQVITAGAVVRPLFGDWLAANIVPTDALDDINPDGGGFDWDAVLREAVQQIRSAPGIAVDLVLLSDLQKIRRHPDLSAVAKQLLDERPLRILVRQIGADAVGGGVLRVSLPERSLRPGETITLDALVLPDVADQSFMLELDGVQVGEAVVTGPPDGIHTLEYFLTVPDPGWHAGRVVKKSDRMPADDSRPFVLHVPEQVAVLLAHGADRSGDGPAGRGGWRFLQQALDPGGPNSLFKVHAVLSEDLVTGDLDAAGLLVLVDPDPLGRTILDGMKRWVQGGGGVLLAAGDPILTGYLQQTLLPALGFPGEKIRFQSRVEGRRMHLVGRTSAMLDGFDKEALGTLEDVVWRRWFSLQDQGATVLLTLSGGDPLLMERASGAGRVMILASNMDPESGDFFSSAMALPLLQRMGAHLSSRVNSSVPSAVIAGREIVLTPGSEWTPSGETDPQVRMPGSAGMRPVLVDWQGSQPILKAGIAEHEGFATFTDGGDTLGMVAVAVPTAESGLHLETPADLGRRLAAVGLVVDGDLSDTEPEKMGPLLKGWDLAPWFFLLALVVLLLELYLGRGAPSASDSHE